MKKKIIPVIIIIALTTIGMLFFKYLVFNNTQLDDCFTIKDSAEINKIIIYKSQSENEQTIILQKKENSWKVNNDYIAKNENITEILKTMMLLKIKSPIPENAKAYVNSILKNSKKVDVFSQDKIIKTYIIGEAIADMQGNYMKINDLDDIYIVHIPALKIDITNKFSADINYWRNKIFCNIKPNQLKKIQITYPQDIQNSFIITIQDKIMLYDFAEKQVNNANIENIKRYTTYFQNIEYENIVENITQDSLRNQKTIFEITITETDDQTTNLKAYNLISNNLKDTDYAIAILNNKDIIKIKYYNIDLLLKKIKFFMN